MKNSNTYAATSWRVKLRPYITTENARDWEADSEKWIFATAIIGQEIAYEPHGLNIEMYVAWVEREFGKLLKKLKN